MKAFGYVFLVLAVVACGIIWQVLRRLSAGTQAFISPERYAIQKVMEMQQALPINPPEEATNFPTERWEALVRYDPEIAPAAEHLRPFGEKWVRILGRDYFALQEDRNYLPQIVQRLTEEARSEAKQEAEKELARKEAERQSRFRKLNDGQFCDAASLAVLSKAEENGYIITVDSKGTIAATSRGKGTSYLRSNSDIRGFGRHI
jgi:hypothetical protein